VEVKARNVQINKLARLLQGVQATQGTPVHITSDFRAASGSKELSETLVPEALNHVLYGSGGLPKCKALHYMRHAAEPDRGDLGAVT
jgi:hypothetical protein